MPMVAEATATISVSLMEVSTAVRPSASVQCRVVSISQPMKPLISMNEFRRSTANGSAPKTAKKAMTEPNATHRHGPRSIGRARNPRPDTVV